MLTIFSTPKPFAGHIGTIQRNAIQSWKRLRPEPEILLFGDDPGAREAAAEFGLRHVPEVGRNEFGTPLVSDIFEQAQRLARHSWLCYVNCDIMFLSDFPAALERLRAWRDRFLMAGQCWDLQMDGSWDFEAPGADDALRSRAASLGRRRGPWSIDFFVFPHGLYRGIPSFALGRLFWDNWLLWRARQAGLPIVDVTEATCVVHQHHDYVGGYEAIWTGPEGRANLQSATEAGERYSLEDASHLLKPAAVERNRLYWLLPWWRKWRAICYASLERTKVLPPSIFPRVGPIWQALWYSGLERTKPMRYRLGLHRRRQTG